MSRPAPTPAALDARLEALMAQRLLPGEQRTSLREGLDELVAWHRDRCPSYARLLDVIHPGYAGAGTLADLPWIPVGLFKSHDLASVPPAERFKVLTSSGTTGAVPGRVVLDRTTAALQTRGLAWTMTALLGPRRLPMLIVDVQDLLTDRRSASARGAGVLGMMTFGRDHLFALDPGQRLREAELRAWLARHGQAPFLVFGFTFMVWEHLVERAGAMGLDLSQGVLVHSGGWKKLLDRSVDRATFKAALARATGLSRVHDFYGMVEQVGSVFLEGEDGLLHPPPFGEVLIRDPQTWDLAPPGQPGVVQVLSLLPRSYPGHSLLTEDLGVLLPTAAGADGRPGRGLSILGRAPRAELRGCSDTQAPVRS